MAEQALEKLSEQLNCAICLNTYTDPRILQCYHIYCSKCLVKLMIPAGQPSLTCPTCRKITNVPRGGVMELQPAFHIDRLLEIRDSLENVKDSAVVEVKVAEKEEDTIFSAEILKCSEHIDKEVELYCESCETVLCLKCVVKGSKHHGHDYDTLDSLYNRYQEEIKSSLEPMEKQLTAIVTAVSQIEAHCDKISIQQAAIEDNINKTFEHLHEILEARKTELISELHQMTQTKLKSLVIQKNKIETIQAQVSSCIDFIREGSRQHSQAEVLMMKRTFTNQIKDLNSFCQPEALQPNTDADLIFLPSSDINTACQNYGKITLGPDPSKCYIMDMLGVARVGEETTVLLQVMNSRNQPCEGPINWLECELVSETTGHVIPKVNVKRKGHMIPKVDTKRRGENQYEISYRPNFEGRFLLHVRVEGLHIQGSPFTVTVQPKISSPVPPFVAPAQPNELEVSPYAYLSQRVLAKGRRRLNTRQPAAPRDHGHPEEHTSDT